MKLRLTDEMIEAVRTTPVPRQESFSSEDWPSIAIRIAALDDLLAGATIKAAAARRVLDRKTVRRMLQLATEVDDTGTCVGYQACIPHKRFAPPASVSAVVPTKGHAFAFQMVLKAIPELAEKLHAFKGSFPTRSSRSPAFNRLFNSLTNILRSKGGTSPVS